MHGLQSAEQQVQKPVMAIIRGDNELRT